MGYILASILASTFILVLFRWMQHSTAVTRHSILVSYLASATTGVILFVTTTSKVVVCQPNQFSRWNRTAVHKHSDASSIFVITHAPGTALSSGETITFKILSYAGSALFITSFVVSLFNPPMLSVRFCT